MYVILKTFCIHLGPIHFGDTLVRSAKDKWIFRRSQNRVVGSCQRATETLWQNCLWNGQEITIKQKSYCVLKSSFSEKATKVWKNLPLVLTLLSKNNCFVKTGRRFFQILWPSHNVWTLNIKLKRATKTQFVTNWVGHETTVRNKQFFTK